MKKQAAATVLLAIALLLPLAAGDIGMKQYLNKLNLRGVEYAANTLKADIKFGNSVRATENGLFHLDADMDQWTVTFSRNDMILKPDQDATVRVTFTSDPLPPGQYTGNITITAETHPRPASGMVGKLGSQIDVSIIIGPYEIPRYALTVLSEPVGNFTFTLDDSKPNLTPKYIGGLEQGLHVVVLEERDGYRFLEWEDGAEEATRQINLNKDTVIKAYFEKLPESFLNTLAGLVSDITFLQTVTAGSIAGLTSVAVFAYHRRKYERHERRRHRREKGGL